MIDQKRTTVTTTPSKKNLSSDQKGQTIESTPSRKNIFHFNNQTWRRKKISFEQSNSTTKKFEKGEGQCILPQKNVPKQSNFGDSLCLCLFIISTRMCKRWKKWL